RGDGDGEARVKVRTRKETGAAPTAPAVLAVRAVGALAVACGDDGEPTAPADAGRGPDPLIVLGTEGNDPNADAAEPPYDKQTVITNAADDPDGLDINGQLCFFPDDPHRLIAGEDTGQPERTPGWGIFEIDGDRVGELSARQVGRLVPTYQNDEPENY